MLVMAFLTYWLHLSDSYQFVFVYAMLGFSVYEFF